MYVHMCYFHVATELQTSDRQLHPSVQTGCAANLRYVRATYIKHQQQANTINRGIPQC